MPNKKLITIKGLVTVNYSAGDTVDVIEYAEKDLTEDEWKDLLYIKENLGGFEDNIISVTDTWVVVYSADNEECPYIYGLSKNEMYDIFAVKIIHYSDIEVVDNNGKPVTPYSLDLFSDFNFGNYYETDFSFGSIPLDSTGIIEPMDYEELKEKVQQINSETTSKDLLVLFGAYPNPVTEISVNRHLYYCGDYIVNMFDVPIAAVSIFNTKTENDEVLYNNTSP